MDSSVAAVSTKAATSNVDQSAVSTSPPETSCRDDSLPPYNRPPTTGPPATTANTALTIADKPPPGPSEIVPNPLIEGLDLEAIDKGVLIPLKTTLEVRQDHSVVPAYITRSPTKCASEVMKYVGS